MKKSFRIKKEEEFQFVFKNGRSTANRRFVLYVLPKAEQKHFRVGISVGKKVGNAVKRNATKRKIRQSLLELKPQINPACDFLIIARPGIAELPLVEVKKNLLHVMNLGQLLIEEK